MKCDMGTLGGMSAVIAGGPAVCALMLPLGCVLCHAWVKGLRGRGELSKGRRELPTKVNLLFYY